MALPITGPINSFPSEQWADNYRSKYRQKLPYDRPLAYNMYRNYGRSESQNYDQTGLTSSSIVKEANFSIPGIAGYANREAHAYNQAYERLRSQVSDRSGWAESIAQINKTRSALNGRLVQVATAVVALKRCDFGKVARILKHPKPSGVTTRRAVADNFLEWEYGWKPMISDIDSSMNLLTSDPGVKYVQGRGSAHHSYLTSTFTRTSNGSYVRNYVGQSGKTDWTVRTGVQIINPNLFLANQLGLIDLALPWKLIPFSFIIDWFVNVEQVISSVTDWYGVTLVHPHKTRFRRGSATEFNETYTYYNATSFSRSQKRAQKSSVEVERSLGIPSPTLVIKPFKGFSLNRGAQALALVLATLGSNLKSK